MGNYHCVPENGNATVTEGEEVRTICVCGPEHTCETVVGRHGSGSAHTDGVDGQGHKASGSPFSTLNRPLSFSHILLPLSHVPIYFILN
jgi:hypothetical protein